MSETKRLKVFGALPSFLQQNTARVLCPKNHARERREGDTHTFLFMFKILIYSFLRNVSQRTVRVVLNMLASGVV